MQSVPTHGPTRMATSAPPSRWPLAPGRIGKLIIWTANTNAVTRPAIGAVRSSRSARARLTATASTSTANRPNASEVGALTSPSLMCIATTMETSSLAN